MPSGQTGAGASDQPRASNESRWKVWGRTAFDKSIVISDWAAGYANAGSAKLGGERFFPKSNDFPEEVDKCERILRAFTVEGVAAEVKEVDVPDGKGSFMKKQRKVLRKIPPKLIKQARGIIIYTSMRSGIAPLGGSGGVGLMMARLPDGSWSAPSSITPNNFAVGLLLGFDIFDAILLVNTDTAMEKFKGHKVTLGAETAVAAGPFGAGISGEMGLDKTPVYSYVRSRGLYGGVEAIAQAFLHRFDENERVYYWPGVTASDIFEGKVRLPPQVEPLHRALRDAELGIAQGDSLDKTIYENVLAPPNRAVSVLQQDEASEMLQDGERLKLPPTPEELDAMEEAGIPDEYDLELERQALQERLEAEKREREEIRNLPPPPKHPDVVKYWANRPRPGANRRVPPPLSPAGNSLSSSRVASPSPLRKEAAAAADSGDVAMDTAAAEAASASERAVDDKVQEVEQDISQKGSSGLDELPIDSEAPPVYEEDAEKIVASDDKKDIEHVTADTSRDSGHASMAAADTAAEPLANGGLVAEHSDKPDGEDVPHQEGGAQKTSDDTNGQEAAAELTKQAPETHAVLNEAGIESEAETDDFEDALTASESAPVQLGHVASERATDLAEIPPTPKIAEPSSPAPASPRPLSPRPESARSVEAASSVGSHGASEGTAAGEGSQKPARPVRPPRARARPVSTLVTEVPDRSANGSPGLLSPHGALDTTPTTAIAEEQSKAPRMMVFLDWDETITAQDTLSLIAPPAGTQQDGEDFAHYTEAYMTDLSSHEQTFGERDTLEKQTAYLESIDEVEKTSVNRVEQGGLFVGVKMADIQRRAETVSFRDGWDGAHEWLEQKAEEGDAETDIISVGWSAEFIRHALAHRRRSQRPRDSEQASRVPKIICANEIEMRTDESGEQVGSGRLTKSKEALDLATDDGESSRSGIRTGVHKLNELKRLRSRSAPSSSSSFKAPVTVYVGDSNTDLPCLLEARYGLLMGGNESLKATIARVGLQEKLQDAEEWLKIQEGEDGGKDTDTGDTETDTDMQNTLIAVRDWDEAVKVLERILARHSAQTDNVA
ncbi:uncharacterized protein PFL1_04089 [Pseudozyma flocculosa PF-1]|uniref:Ysc84 actin-binding domain-containing protein n=1 Tax=Pseudozyma flocculosa PF-1 TaxID=1277687 RepID=A0A061H5R4_9BASI|nr:uncharacterized protein PFL1_04089 [Pseudozyma flocculosa PF-1]EPQ28262.1 hypothetical protein PFL1_04089 [Pseudozyma flocculosa PF-1]